MNWKLNLFHKLFCHSSYIVFLHTFWWSRERWKRLKSISTFDSYFLFVHLFFYRVISQAHTSKTTPCIKFIAYILSLFVDIVCQKRFVDGVNKKSRKFSPLVVVINKWLSTRDSNEQTKFFHRIFHSFFYVFFMVVNTFQCIIFVVFHLVNKHPLDENKYFLCDVTHFQWHVLAFFAFLNGKFCFVL